jgi:hypothetical protein
MATPCVRCGTDKLGDSRFCTLCYGRLCRACPKCMLRGAKGQYHVIRRGRAQTPVECSVCCNERWVLMDEAGKIVG